VQAAALHLPDTRVVMRSLLVLRAVQRQQRAVYVILATFDRYKLHK